MVLPLLAVGALAASGALGTLHGGMKYVENQRYWSEYAKNTRHRPRYRARNGYYDYLSVAGSGFANAGLTYGSLYNYYNR